jgi:hypothetical protein
VSACKWLTRIEATTFDAFDAYWVQRGWAASGPIKIAARIDTPASLRQFPAGRRPIAGVAWAQTRGIARVEVKVDDGAWADAQLSPQVDADLWRQWVLPYDFGPAALAHRPRDQRRRRGADRGAGRPLPRRSQRLALRPGRRRLTARPADRPDPSRPRR